jgi:putative DNA primase/helicase
MPFDVPHIDLAAERQKRAPVWPEPQPLPEGLAPVANFSFKLLPAAIRPWARDICERVSCPPDYVGAAAVTALGAALGRKIAVRPQAQTDWTVTANQWCLIIGRPGVLKSPAMEAALAPLKRLAAVACDAYEDTHKHWERDRAVAKLRAAAAEKQATKVLNRDPHADVGYMLEADESAEPTLKRYIANDSTAAALGELLRQNPNGLLVHRDEVVSLLRALDREDNAEARGFYLTAWNGDSAFTFDRIGRGMNLHIPAVCLSLLGSTQPGRIAHYVHHAVKGGAGDDGLIQRFGLLVWPDTAGPWREVDRWPETESRRQAFTAFKHLDELDPATVGASQDEGFDGEPDGLPYLRFDENGLGLFREWRTDLEAKLRNGELHPAGESHLAKFRKLVPGLALLLHLANGLTGPVGRQAVIQALAWAEYLDWGFRVVSTRLGAKPRQTRAAAISGILACAYTPEGWLGCAVMARTRLGSGIARG